MSKVIELENKEDFIDLKKEGKVLVDFYAVWCGPCQAMKPVIDKYSDENEDVKVLTVDVDKFAEVASEYNVMSIPTFVVFKDGEPVESKNGAIDEEVLKNGGFANGNPLSVRSIGFIICGHEIHHGNIIQERYL